MLKTPHAVVVALLIAIAAACNQQPAGTPPPPRDPDDNDRPPIIISNGSVEIDSMFNIALDRHGAFKQIGVDYKQWRHETGAKTPTKYVRVSLDGWKSSIYSECSSASLFYPFSEIYVTYANNKTIKVAFDSATGLLTFVLDDPAHQNRGKEHRLRLVGGAKALKKVQIKGTMNFICEPDYKSNENEDVSPTIDIRQRVTGFPVIGR